jgi:hypothetical protein
MMKVLHRAIMLAVIVAPTLAAQEPSAPISAAERRAVTDAVVREVERGYQDSVVAERMAADVRERQRRGEYAGIRSAEALADSLTTQLRAISHDGHLRILAHEPTARGASPPEAGLLFASEDAWRTANYGFERVERLPGNIGYLEARIFFSEEASAPTIAAAMNFLAHTEALVIDLRRHTGGEPETVRHLISYLLSPDSTLINQIHWRLRGETESYWSRSELPGSRYGPDRPVFVLTSARTVSAAEELAYDLKHMDRATIVGETTEGAANPAPLLPLTPRFSIRLPTGRVINPITRGNWEGKGVEPDIAVPARQALAAAHIAAVEAILTRTTDPSRRRQLEGLLRDLRGPRPEPR